MGVGQSTSEFGRDEMWRGGFPCVHAVATTPAQRLGVLLRSLHPAVSAFPERVVGSACASSFSRLAQRIPRGFLLCDSSFQPRDVLQQALAGQDEEVIAELRILEVDFKQPFISYGQHLPVLYTFDRRGSPLIGRKEAKFTHKTSRRKFNADFRDQKLSCDRQEHFGSCIILLE